MKKILLLIASIATLGAQAEIHQDYNAPTLVEAFLLEGKATIWFTEPHMGGTLWESHISSTDGLGGLTIAEGNPDLRNGGNGGSELYEFASTAAYSLATPELTLKAGTTYAISYYSAGTRASSNKTIALQLMRGTTAVSTIEQAYELTPSLSWQQHEATFTVPEDAADYTIRFAVACPNAKSAGIYLKTIVVSQPAPEGQGAFLGYTLYNDGEPVAQFTNEEAPFDRLYRSYTLPTRLKPSTTYTFALQARYEGGESPLTTTKEFTTPERKMEVHADYAAPTELTFAGYEQEITAPLRARLSFKAPVNTTEDEERGELTGYRLYIISSVIGASRPTYELEDIETQEGLSYLWVDDLSFATTYQFSLQAVYEGGYSEILPAEGITVITPADPLEGISTTLAPGTTTLSAPYAIDGRRISTQQRGIRISAGKKIVK